MPCDKQSGSKHEFARIIFLHNRKQQYAVQHGDNGIYFNLLEVILEIS